ncbi:MAG: YCF48-related protein [Psychroflexus sp.]|nr:YCF48-related protein [Psychroflexus sp.]
MKNKYFHNKSILLLVFTLLSSQLCAQEWILRTPLKSISKITTLEVTNNNSIYALDTSPILEYLYTSSDVGETYQRYKFPDARKMQMIANNSAFVLTTYDLYFTNDDFQTITSQDLPGYTFNSLYFLNENEGFIAGDNGVIFHTDDAGQTWTEQTTPITENLKSIHFINDLTGFAVGEDISFLKTIDGGTTWTEIILNIDSYWNFQKVYFFSETKGVIAGSNGYIFYTHDAGDTWTQAITTTNRIIYDVAQTHNDNLVAVGQSGRVLTSDDEGLTWTTEIIGSGDLNTVSASTNLTYIGTEAEILQSSDLLTWTSHLKGVTMSDLNQMSFADLDQGLIVGKGQTGSAVFHDVMFRTSDGGQNWEKKNVSGGYNNVHMRDNGQAITSRGNISYVGLSQDFGETWTTVPGPNITQQFIAKTSWISSMSDFFVGGGNFFSSDGLYHYQNSSGWTHIAEVGNVTQLKFSEDNQTGFLINSVNQIFKSVDAGDTWTELTFSAPSYGQIEIIDDNTVYIGDYVTFDGGQNFELHGFEGYILAYRFFDANTALGVTNLGQVYKTIDAGMNWTEVSSAIIEDSNCCNLFHILEDKIIATSFRSDIYTLDIGNVLQTRSYEEDLVPILIYPNPTKGKLHFDWHKNINALQLTIYSSQGQLIKKHQLKNEKQKSIDVSKLSQGIYFVHLKTNEGKTYIKKLIKE